MTAQKELIPMRPGDLLRHKREQASLTLEQAAGLSRIKPDVLAAIESDETDAIAAVYLRGYVRNYARFLGVDAAAIEESLQYMHGSEPAVQSVFSVPSARGHAEKWLKTSSYLAATAVIAALVWQFTHEAVRFSQRDSQLSSTVVAPPEAAERGADEAVPGRRPAKTHLNASIASVEMIERRKELEGKAVAEQAWAAIGGQVGDTDPENGLHRLAISTSADTWVEILDGDGTQLELDLIRAGSQRDYTGPAPFSMMIGRASAVVLSLDGDAVDLGPHTRGNVARLSLGGEETPGNGIPGGAAGEGGEAGTDGEPANGPENGPENGAGAGQEQLPDSGGR
jgi:cytoskeleton protein RodZ